MQRATLDSADLRAGQCLRPQRLAGGLDHEPGCSHTPPGGQHPLHTLWTWDSAALRLTVSRPGVSSGGGLRVVAISSALRVALDPCAYLLVQALHYPPGFTPSRLAQDREHPFLWNQILHKKIISHEERLKPAPRKMVGCQIGFF